MITNKRKYVVFGNDVNKNIVDMCDLQESNLWLASEINLTHDAEDFLKLTPEEQSYLKQVLAFFAGSDGIVGENLALNFIQEIEIPEVRYFYYFQSMMEAVHAKVYSQMINTFVPSQTERDELFDSIENHPIIKKKAEWAFKYMKRDSKLSERLVAFLAIEGIFFSGSFATIFWLRDRGLLANSLGVANEFISRDECHIEGTEILTDKGFVDFRNINKDTKVAQYDKYGNITFTEPTRIIINEHDGDMIRIHHSKYEVIVTPNHDMLGYNPKTDTLKKIKASDIKYNATSLMPVTGNLAIQGEGLTPLEKLYIAIQANGTEISECSKTQILTVTNEVEAEKLKNILQECNLEYTIGIFESHQGFVNTSFKFELEEAGNFESFDWAIPKSYQWCHEFCNEFAQWSTDRYSTTFTSFNSTNKKCIDKVQQIAVLAGKQTSIETRYLTDEHSMYYLTITDSQQYKRANRVKKETIHYKGKVYCVEVPTGMIITRYNNKVAIAGNCLHADFAVTLYKEYLNDLSQDRITEIILSALEIEKEFIQHALPVRLIGMNTELMNQYLEFVTDGWLVELGCKKVFNVSQPFDFMRTIGQKRKDLFHEKSRTNYARATTNQTINFNEL